MAIPVLHLNDVSQAIQLALTPAFLLTALGGLLNVMAGRLARIIDRGRTLTETDGLAERMPGHVHQELMQLDRRRHLTSVAITSCTLAALLLCLVVGALFIEVYLGAPLRGVVGVLFTLSMLALIVGLAYFLREVHLATTSIRITSARRFSPPKS
ncbi:MAG TPA: DUF2721 domain-containing protein [Burkholderiaceae bacterium]|nr:DUF2721 domain-containing protein [Burkholderiaceae bacterium]